MDAFVDRAVERRRGDRRVLPRAEDGRRKRDREEAHLIDDSQVVTGVNTDSAIRYTLLLVLLCLIGVQGVRSANTYLAPMLHDDRRIENVAAQMQNGRNYQTFDLNIETRLLRAEHIANLDRTPYVAILGASHWQEGHSNLARGVDMYNAHVHRDYYEDILGVTEMFVRADRLPRKMVITIRDNLFTPVEKRTDFLWVPILPYYRAMAARLGIPAHDAYTNGLTPRLRQTLSLPLLRANVERYLASPKKPGFTQGEVHPTLDTLLSDGSIRWSTMHQQGFTQFRARAEALSFAYAKRNHKPIVDPAGLAAVDRVLGFLAERGVEVYLAHPPFNPVYWDAVQDSPYKEGLDRIVQITDDLAAKYGFGRVGGFNPYEVGCRADQYIDGEHSNPECLGRIIEEFLRLDARAQN